MRKILTAIGLSLLSAFAIADDKCVYKKPEKSAELLAFEKRAAVKSTVQDKKEYLAIGSLMGACQLSNIPNDIRHLYREVTEEDGHFQEEFANNPDVALHVADGVAKTSTKVMLKLSPGLMMVGVKAFKAVAGGLNTGLNALVGSSCAMNMDLMKLGFTHAERVKYLNLSFQHEMARWEYANPSPGCQPSVSSKAMKYALNLMRHQAVGASQGLEMSLKALNGQKIDLKEIDVGEDDHGHGDAEGHSTDHGPEKVHAHDDHDEDHDEHDEHDHDKKPAAVLKKKN